MKNVIVLLLSSLTLLGCLAACDKKAEPPKGEMYLETAAKNSPQAKQAEADLLKAAEKSQKTVDDAMKQAQENQ